MPDSFLSLPDILYFLLLFCRISGLFIAAPILSTAAIPRQSKVAMAVILAFIVYTVLPDSPLPLNNIHPLTYAILIAGEVTVGYIMGFVASLIFVAIQFGGRLIDVVMGMHIASAMNPLTRERQSLIGQLQYLIVILLFLQLNGHHLLIRGMLDSFTLLPLGAVRFGPTFIQAFMAILYHGFLAGMQLAIPVMGTLFLIDFSLGIIAKGVPQMNVFLTGMPLKATVGFITMFLAFSYYGAFFTNIPRLMYDQLMLIVRVL